MKTQLLIATCLFVAIGCCLCFIGVVAPVAVIPGILSIAIAVGIIMRSAIARKLGVLLCSVALALLIIDVVRIGLFSIRGWRYMLFEGGRGAILFLAAVVCAAIACWMLFVLLHKTTHEYFEKGSSRPRVNSG